MLESRLEEKCSCSSVAARPDEVEAGLAGLQIARRQARGGETVRDVGDRPIQACVSLGDRGDLGGDLCQVSAVRTESGERGNGLDDYFSSAAQCDVPMIAVAHH